MDSKYKYPEKFSIPMIARHVTFTVLMLRKAELEKKYTCSPVLKRVNINNNESSAGRFFFKKNIQGGDQI